MDDSSSHWNEPRDDRTDSDAPEPRDVLFTVSLAEPNSSREVAVLVMRVITDA